MKIWLFTSEMKSTKSANPQLCMQTELVNFILFLDLLNIVSYDHDMIKVTLLFLHVIFISAYPAVRVKFYACQYAWQK